MSTVTRLPELRTSVDEFTGEELGKYDELMSRSGRLADIFIVQYLRTRIKIEDPGFSGSMRAMLNLAEKLNIIDSAEAWNAIRELRNQQSHEYEDEDLLKLFKDVLQQVPRLEAIKAILKNAS